MSHPARASSGDVPAPPARIREPVVPVQRGDHAEGFGGCTNIGQCTQACPKEIPLDVISTLNRDYRLATTGGRRRHIA